MSAYEPDPNVRLKVASWPEDAPRGAVARFCREHGVSRSWFYKVRARALAEGTWPAMELGSHRPLANPAQTAEDVAALAVKLRRELAQNGLDHGPLSVEALMRRRGLKPPLASLAAWGETSAAALAVVKTAIARHGIPRKFLSDNGRALNPSRLGHRGALVAYLEALGTQPITGRPYKPTTQGKNERFHRTLFGFLSAQPVQATTLAELQAQIDAFDEYYNTEREHQGHGKLHLTPREAWDRTPKADPPTPPQPTPTPVDPEITIRTGRRPKGVVTIFNCHFLLGAAWAGKTVRVVHDEHTVAFYDEHGSQILTHPRPPKGTRFVPRSGLKHPAPAEASTLT